MLAFLPFAPPIMTNKRKSERLSNKGGDKSKKGKAKAGETSEDLARKMEAIQKQIELAKEREAQEAEEAKEEEEQKKREEAKKKEKAEQARKKIKVEVEILKQKPKAVGKKPLLDFSNPEVNRLVRERYGLPPSSDHNGPDFDGSEGDEDDEEEDKRPKKKRSVAKGVEKVQELTGAERCKLCIDKD